MWGVVEVASQFHKLKVRGSNPLPTTNLNIMEKKIYALKANILPNLVNTMNEEGVTKGDVVQVFCNAKDEYVAIIYK